MIKLLLKFLRLLSGYEYKHKEGLILTRFNHGKSIKPYGFTNEYLSWFCIDLTFSVFEFNGYISASYDACANAHIITTNIKWHSNDDTYSFETCFHFSFHNSIFLWMHIAMHE